MNTNFNRDNGNLWAKSMVEQLEKQNLKGLAFLKVVFRVEKNVQKIEGANVIVNRNMETRSNSEVLVV